MQLRYRVSSGTLTLELDDDATVSQLFESLKSSLGQSAITVKYGWPPKALSVADQGDVTLKSLGLQRESLTVVPAESSSVEAPKSIQQTTTTSTTNSSGNQETGIKGQDIRVKLDDKDTTLVLRVMPDDNSCLFTAVGGALCGVPLTENGLLDFPAEQYAPETLRRLVVDCIRNNPHKYTAAVLGQSPAAYCDKMMRPDTWGGEIELSIFSDVFKLEFSVVDVKGGNIITIGEGNCYNQRCVLVWSGIHYDRVVEVLLPDEKHTEYDITRWPTEGCDYVLEGARKMCKTLRDDHHYYTDTSDFIIQCNECGWVGQGEKALTSHVTITGHLNITEITDNST